MQDPQREDDSGRRDADAADAIHVKALGLHRAGHLEDAMRLYRGALALVPAHQASLRSLGVAVVQQRLGESAARLLARVVRIDPAASDAWNNLAAAFKATERVGAAVASLERAIALEPGRADLWYNRANLHQALGAAPAAIAGYRRAATLQPEHVNAHWNLALCLLREGRFTEGWAEYEWRWLRPGTPIDRRVIPEWRGEPFPGKTLLVLSDQGLGDAIQFARFLPDVAGRGGTLIVECQPELAFVMTGIEPRVRVMERDPVPVDADLQTGLASLPGMLGVTLETIRAPVRYLAAPPGPGPELPSATFNVGLAWAGSPLHPRDAERSLAFDRLAVLGEVPGIALFGVQKGPAANALRPGGAFAGNLVGEGDDLAHTARCLEALDLVITVDTAVAHLSGALGRPTWVLLPHHADWRWLTGREDSPWYPTVRLFRQRAPGDWDGVLARVRDALRGLVERK